MPSFALLRAVLGPRLFFFADVARSPFLRASGACARSFSPPPRHPDRRRSHRRDRRARLHRRHRNRSPTLEVAFTVPKATKSISTTYGKIHRGQIGDIANPSVDHQRLRRPERGRKWRGDRRTFRTPDLLLPQFATTRTSPSRWTNFHRGMDHQIVTWRALKIPSPPIPIREPRDRSGECKPAAARCGPPGLR